MILLQSKIKYIIGLVNQKLHFIEQLNWFAMSLDFYIAGD